MALLEKNSWNYLNEGNVHIVLEVLNSDYVIRLIKESDSNPPSIELMKKIVEFVNFVTKPLIMSNYEPEELLILTPEEVTKLPGLLHEYRPKNRMHKSSITPYAVRAPNLTILSAKLNDNFCIEIKPKEGYLSTKLKKLGKCFYCLKQYSKISENQISRISSYCPLDLFSGDRRRMHKSLLSLLENPQNNWKIFHNSKLIFSDKTNEKIEKVISSMNIFENITHFIKFVTEILLSNYDNYSQLLLNYSDDEAIDKYDIDEVKSHCNCYERTSLPPKSFLYKLLSLQKLRNTPVTHPQTQDMEYVQSILDFVISQNLNLSHSTARPKFLQSLDPFHLSMLSAIFRDCSIMITFSTTYIEGYPSICIGEHKVPYKISVTDLEPKHPRTLTRRIDTESKLIENHKQTLIQPHSETRTKQLEAWQQLITDYLKTNKQSTIDVREAQNSPLFNNTAISRKLSQESILTVLENMAKSGKAAPIDKNKNIWEVYWHSLDEWGNMIYSWASNNGLNNTVCTLFELREGDNTTDEEFHGLDINVLLKALKTLQLAGKCELMEFDDSLGVKFF